MNTNQLVSTLKADLENILKSNKIEIKVYENSSGVLYTLEEFFDQYNPEEIQKGQCNLMFKVDWLGKPIASFQLKDMYNCCGIIVGSDLFVNPNFTNRGLGTLINKFMIDFSRYYGYGILQAADKVTNNYQTRIFEKLGWSRTIEFINPKTKNNLAIWLFKF